MDENKKSPFRVYVGIAASALALIVIVTAVLSLKGKSGKTAEAVTSESSTEETTKWTDEMVQAYMESLEAERQAVRAAQESRDAERKAELESQEASRAAIEATRPTSAEAETAAVITDAVTKETLTAPEGAAAVLPTAVDTEAPTIMEPDTEPVTEAVTEPVPAVPAAADGEIEITEEIIDDCFPELTDTSRNNPVNRLLDWQNPSKFYEMNAVCEAWCNNGNGDKNSDCSAQLTAISGRSAHSRAIPYPGRDVDMWTLCIEIMTEAECGGGNYEWMKAYYDPETDITTVWYAYGANG